MKTECKNIQQNAKENGGEQNGTLAIHYYQQANCRTHGTVVGVWIDKEQGFTPRCRLPRAKRQDGGGTRRTCVNVCQSEGCRGCVSERERE